MKKVKNVLIFIVFFIYTVLVFYIKNYMVLGILSLVHILVMLSLKISLKQGLKNILAILLFILFTVIINIFAMGLEDAILIGIRLIIICNATFIFTKLLTPYKIAEVIQILLTPLKVLGVNPENVAIIISIAIAFVPILARELKNVLYALKAKGVNTNALSIIRNVNLIMTPLFVSIIRRANQLEYALKAKGFQEE